MPWKHDIIRCEVICTPDITTQARQCGRPHGVGLASGLAAISNAWLLPGDRKSLVWGSLGGMSSPFGPYLSGRY